MLSRPVTITVGALANMLRIQQVGELPAVIAPDPIWNDVTSDQEAVEEAWREFTEVGLTDRPHYLHGDTLDTLHALAHPGIEYLAVMLGRQTHEAVVVASRGDETVIARREGNTVTLTSVRDVSLPETLLRQIPDARPAPIEAANVRINGLAGREGDPFAGNSAIAQDARTLAYLKRQRLICQGELYVAVRDAYGRRQRSDAIRFQDYHVGRVVVVIGGGYLSVAPATKVLLRDRLRASHQELVG